MNAAALAWSRDSICLRPRSLEPERFAADVYERTCRTDFSAPGFCVVSAGRAIGSVGCRQLMVDLKRAMASVHEAATGETLIFLSAVRADQQTTTKPHLDGGPDECLLMLGYEPSEVDAELEISDYDSHEVATALSCGRQPTVGWQRESAATKWRQQDAATARWVNCGKRQLWEASTASGSATRRGEFQRAAATSWLSFANASRQGKNARP